MKWLRELLIWLRKRLQRILAALAILIVIVVLVLIFKGWGDEPVVCPENPTGLVQLENETYDCEIVVTASHTIVAGDPKGTVVKQAVTVTGTDVTVTGLKLDGGSVTVKPTASDVTVSENEFTACAGVCVKLAHGDEDVVPTNVIVRGNLFHDIATHAVACCGTNVVVERNTFERASAPDCEAKKCPEFVRLQAGGNWQIVGNRLSNAEAHGPQIRVFPTSDFQPALHDVLIANNIASTDRKDSFIVDVEGSEKTLYVTARIWIVSNTFLGLPGKQAVGVDEMGPNPLVANNLIVNQGGAKECDRVDAVTNVVRKFEGEPCAGYTLGEFDLTESGIPADTDTNRTYVIDKATDDPAGCHCTPRRDINGVLRTPPFDIGAAEHEQN